MNSNSEPQARNSLGQKKAEPETAVTANPVSKNVSAERQTQSENDTYCVHYQIPANVLAWIWWKRQMLMPQRLFGIIILAAILGYLSLIMVPRAFQDDISLAILFSVFLAVFLAFFTPYRKLLKNVDMNSQLTDPKSLEFDLQGLIVTGPDWRNEADWSRVFSFSEDDEYFYLTFTKVRWLVSPIPKNAFTEEEKSIFRKYLREGAVNCQSG
jgi:YcxB-like protein